MNLTYLAYFLAVVFMATGVLIIVTAVLVSIELWIRYLRPACRKVNMWVTKKFGS